MEGRPMKAKRLIRRKEGSLWRRVPMKSLRPGDLFTIEETDGTCEAVTKPVYRRDLKAWSIQAIIGPYSSHNWGVS